MQTFGDLDPQQLSDDDLLRGRDQTLEQMAWARKYSLQLIESIPSELWYRVPSGYSSHVAWQVGHLAVSQYGLMLFRQRGRAAGDLELMPGWLRKQFGRGTIPSSSNEGMPNADELLEKLTRIHAQSLEEVSQLSAATLREATEMPYTAYPIKLGALLFAPLHEALHAGQIGVLRRLHGLTQLR